MATQLRIVGSIMGLGVGDALGYPAEFRERAQILRQIGPEGITDFISYKDSRFTRPVIWERDLDSTPYLSDGATEWRTPPDFGISV